MSSVGELINELRTLKERQREISSQLTNIIMKDNNLMEAIKSGIVKLNFSAPQGFYRRLRR